jgi:hypothetical protein
MPVIRGNNAAVRAAHHARQRHHATIAANLQRQRQAQASLGRRIAAAVAEQEGISLDPNVDETAFLASIRALSDAQRFRLQWRIMILIVALGAFVAPQDTARQAFALTDIVAALYALTTALSNTRD